VGGRDEWPAISIKNFIATCFSSAGDAALCAVFPATCFSSAGFSIPRLDFLPILLESGRPIALLIPTDSELAQSCLQLLALQWMAQALHCLAR
jgi:hypothetical protein